MAPATIRSWDIVLLFTTLVFNIVRVSATNCYYPNGDLSTEGDAPCVGNEGTCCPFNWQCMSNGLCFNPDAQIYGRYTCTDQTWQSPDCPQICTYNNTAIGNEALLQCPNGDWCCDKNRDAGNCCDTLFAGTEYFKLSDPHEIAFISATSPVTKAKTVTNSPATFTDGTFLTQTQPGTTLTTKELSTKQFPTTAPTPIVKTTTPATLAQATISSTTFTHKTVTTGKDGSIETVTQVITMLATSTALGASQNHSRSTSNLGMIVRVALGVPLVLIIAGIAAFFTRRRHRARKAKRYASLSTPPRPRSPPVEANYCNLAPGSHAPELEGFPVAPTRSKSGRKSELFGSDSYITSPTPSRTSTGSTLLPQYSPKRMSMVQINEEPQELWGGYVPYRQQAEKMAETVVEERVVQERETAAQHVNESPSVEGEKNESDGI